MNELYLPRQVESVINTIAENGFEAYAVGGCVRDSLLGNTPKDYDVTTSASPEDIMRIFPKTIPTGIAFGTVTVLCGGMPIEVTTFRSDGEYDDFRRPTTVLFGTHIEDDLSRRDFTVNAMAYNHESGIVDLFSGKSDLQRKIIRCVGNPTDRFTEDALRIMRCFRFALRLGFEIEKNTLAAALELSENLKKISVERIAAELFGCLLTKQPSRISALLDTDCLSFLGLNGGCDLSQLDDIMNDRYARLAALMLMTKSDLSLLKKLKLDNKTINSVSALIKCFDKTPPTAPSGVCKMLSVLPHELWEQYFSLRETLCKDDTRQSRAALKYVVDNDLPYKISQLDINGNQLIESGIVQKGKAVGEMLNYLLERVIDEPELNNKGSLMEIAANRN